MIDIRIMSQRRAVRASQDFTTRTAIVSITAPGQSLPEFAGNPKIIGIFRMQFWDIDSPIPGRPDFEPPKQGDFDGLKEFVDRMVQKRVQLFVVHCAAGISRSAATGAAISDYLHLHADILHNPNYAPNRLVYRLARNEFGIPLADAAGMSGNADAGSPDKWDRETADNMENSAYAKNPVRTVKKVYRYVRRGKSVEQIAKKCRISEGLAERIVRLCMTHPNATVKEILTKMGIR